MALQDKVNLTFWSGNLSFTVITSREQAEAFRESWIPGTPDKLEVSGLYNSADGNQITLAFKSDEIDGMQIMELNKF